MSKEHIHIKRRVKQKDFECDYNGTIAHGKTAVLSYRNAKKKYDMKDLSEQLDILDADFNKTLEVTRI
jgi:hypothetical protein